MKQITMDWDTYEEEISKAKKSSENMTIFSLLMIAQGHDVYRYFNGDERYLKELLKYIKVDKNV